MYQQGELKILKNCPSWTPRGSVSLGMIETEWREQKSEPSRKSVGFPKKPKIITRYKLTPQESHPEFQNRKNFCKGLNNVTGKKIDSQMFVFLSNICKAI